MQRGRNHPRRQTSRLSWKGLGHVVGASRCARLRGRSRARACARVESLFIVPPLTGKLIWGTEAFDELVADESGGNLLVEGPCDVRPHRGILFWVSILRGTCSSGFLDTWIGIGIRILRSSLICPLSQMLFVDGVLSLRLTEMSIAKEKVHSR